MNLKNYIREVPDFPKPGILFRDISPILADFDVFESAIEDMVCRVHIPDYFVGIESRGFILASALAAKYHRGFIPIRKAGKLPPPTMFISYNLEYGADRIEIAPGKGRVVIVDDVIATGGTMRAATTLCQMAGYTVVDRIVLVELQKQGVKAVVSYA